LAASVLGRTPPKRAAAPMAEDRRADTEVLVLSTKPIANPLINAISNRRCPRCGSSDVYRRHRRGIV